MKKSLLSILALALVAVGCQNYDDQFDSLNADIAALTTKVNGLDAGVAAQVTALQSLVTNLSTQVTALGNSALTTTDLTTALAGVLTNIATVSSELTALDSSVATSIAGVNTNVAALTTQLTAVQTSALTSADLAALDEVTNLNEEMVAVQAALDELLAAQASVQGITITNQATLDYVETLVETDGTPSSYIVNGDVTITAATATGYEAGYVEAISKITATLASVIGDMTVNVSSTTALDMAQLTYVSGDLAITGKMPSGFKVANALSLALTVNQADISLPTLTSAANGVRINTGTTTVTNVSIANLTNGAVTTAANTLALANADVDLGAGHPATATTVKSLIAGNATTALAGATIIASGSVDLATKVVGTTSINAGGNVTLSSGVTGSSLTNSTINSEGDISIAALTIGAGATAIATDGKGGGSITLGATTSTGAITAVASGSTISAASLNSQATGAMALTATSVNLSGLATMTTALTVNTATSLSLPALVNTAAGNTITGAAVTAFSAPLLVTAAEITGAVGTYEVGSLTDKAHIDKFTTMTGLTLNAQAANLVMDTADKMVTLNYTGKAAASNAAQANDLTISGAASLTTANIAGSSDIVTLGSNSLMTSLATAGFIRSLIVSGATITSITTGHQGLNGGAKSAISITSTLIPSLDLSNMKWVGTMTITGNASLTSITMPTATAAADNANVTNAAGGIAVSIGTNSLTGVWSNAVAASGSSLYQEGTFSTAPGITGAKTWLNALIANVNLAVASVTYTIEIDDADTAMDANKAVSTAIGANAKIDNEGGAAELALLPN